jgi:Zn-dependent protease
VQPFRLGRVAGIDLYVHWTFPILLLYWCLQGFQTGGTTWGIFNALLIVAMFGCVLLHELGHSFAARYFGIGTWGISLSPIGGLAMLEYSPRNPKHEFWITVAGPAVNVAIAGVIYALISLVNPGDLTSRASWLIYEFVRQLMWVNIGMALFNLLPAFPMDGGRILRSVLASWMDYCRATRIAVRVGQVVAIGIAVSAFLGYFGLMALLIAYFVFTSGEEELQRVC